MGFEFFEEREFKETELGPLPVDWQVVRLGEVVEIRQGKQLSSKEDIEGKVKMPFLRTSNVLWNKIDLKSISFMYFTQEEMDKLRLKSGDVLICEGGAVGRTAVWEGQIENCFYQNHLYRVRVDESRLFNYFLSFFMQYAIVHKNLLVSDANRTTIPNLSSARLRLFPIPLPPLEEQKAIAEVLRRVQVAIEKTEEVIRATKGLKKSMMKHLFTYGNVPIDKVDRVKLKETEIGLIPEHWQVVRLGEVVEEATNGDWGNDKFTDGFSQCHVIRGTDFTKMDRGLYNEVPKRYIKTSKLSSLALKPNDLLIELSGGGPDQPTGRIFIVRDHIIERLNPVCFSNFVKRIRVNMELTHPEFFYRYWQYLYIQGRTRLYERRTTGIRNFKFLDFINSENISLPPLKEQKEIARILQAVDEKIQKEQERKKALENLFKSLLHNLMSGKIRIKMGE